MAKVFGVADSTWNLWKTKHPEFAQALSEGKDEADSKVAASLYQRATGYRHIAFKMFQHEGRVVTKRYVEHYPPDTTACIFWLKNRHPELWRDVWKGELTGANGGPVEVKDVSDIDAARAIAFVMAEAAQAVENARRTGNAAAKQKEKA